MATNPSGKGTKTIGINMNQKMAEELERRTLFRTSTVATFRIDAKGHF